MESILSLAPGPALAEEIVPPVVSQTAVNALCELVSPLAQVFVGLVSPEWISALGAVACMTIKANDSLFLFLRQGS